MNRLIVALIFIAIFSRAGMMRAETTDTELETAVTMMAKINSCYSPAFSPDGKRVAFVSNLNGIPQIWIVSSAGGWPELVTALEDQVQSVTWSPDGSWLAFVLAPGGGMNQQIYLIRPDGSGLRRLTAGGKDNNWLGPWTRDGSLLAIASNERSGAAMDAYAIDVSTGKKKMVAENKGIGFLLDVSQNNDLGLLYRMKNRGDEDLYLVRLSGGAETHLTPHEGPGAFGSGVLSKDGKTVFLISNKDRDLTAFARIQLKADGTPGPIEVLSERKDAELEDFELNEQGTIAALVWNVAGRNELSFVDLQSFKLESATQPPAELIRGLDWSQDGAEVAMTLSGAAQPSDVWILNRKTNQYRQITFSPHAGVDLSKLVRPELVRLKAEDGVEISGWLYRPRFGQAPWPTVLNFHGGPESQEQPSFKSVFQALLARGIAVFSPNVRGSSGFGKKYVNLDNGPLRVHAVSDIKACVDYVVRSGVADPKRLGIMGGSYGGYMVMAGLSEYPDMFSAGVNLFGVVNFETFFAQTEPWMAAISKVEYGDPDTQAEMLRNLSPIHKVDRVKAATLVLHGANDTNVPVVEAEQVVGSLKKRNVPVDYILFPDEGHGFQKAPNRIRSNVAIVQWFDKYLKN